MKSKIRTQVFLAFTALALTASLSGCIIDATSSGSCADNRYVSVSWDIQNRAGDSLSCSTVGGSTVRLVLGDFDYWDWSCSSYGGSTPSSLPEDSYFPTYMQLYDLNNVLLSDTRNASGSITVTVPHCDYVPLGTVIFGVN